MRRQDLSLRKRLGLAYSGGRLALRLSPRPKSCSCRHILTYVDFDSGPERRARGFEQASRDFRAHVSLTAVLADLGGHFADYERPAVAFQRYGRMAWPSLAVLANRAFHSFRLLPKPGSQNAGSGS